MSIKVNEPGDAGLVPAEDLPSIDVQFAEIRLGKLGVLNRNSVFADQMHWLATQRDELPRHRILSVGLTSEQNVLAGDVNSADDQPRSGVSFGFEGGDQPHLAPVRLFGTGRAKVDRPLTITFEKIQLG